MGYIYKITNKINSKIYIGQTSRTIQIRWHEHLKNSDYLKDKYPLYKAMKKYGIENFVIEELEKCSDSLLDEREIYWIKQYNSFDSDNGYNCTNGGKGKNIVTTYDENIDEIAKRYQEGERLDLLCKEFHHDYTTIRRELLKMDIKINTLAGPQKLSKRIKAIDPKTGMIVKEYNSISEAARSLCEEGKNFRAIGNHISKYKNTNTISHGFLWKTID